LHPPNQDGCVRYLCSIAALKIIVILREKAKLIEIISHRIHSKLLTKKKPGLSMIISLHYFFPENPKRIINFPGQKNC